MSDDLVALALLWLSSVILMRALGIRHHQNNAAFYGSGSATPFRKQLKLTCSSSGSSGSPGSMGRGAANML
jgi:hypothetical protein